MLVLVIDDNRDDRLLVIRELERAFPDLQVREIIDRQEFEQVLNTVQFDAVVTDYQLRWGTGIEVLEAVKAQCDKCPVIMFTNTGTQEIAVEAMKRGLDDYLLKSRRQYIRVPVAVSAALERYQMQKRAELLQVRLQSLLNQVNIGVFRSTPDGQLIESNTAFLRILGTATLTEAQSVFSSIVTERDTLIPGQQQVCEVNITQAAGEPIWLDVSQTLTSAGDQSVIDGILEDITHRKRSENALKRYAARLETLRSLDRAILEAQSPVEIAQAALTAIAPLIHPQRLDVVLFDAAAQQVSILAVYSQSTGTLPTADRWSFEDFGDIATLQRGQVVLIADLDQRVRSPVQQELYEQGIRCLVRVPLMVQQHVIGALNLSASQPDAFSAEAIAIAEEVATQLAIAIQQSRLREDLQHYTERLEDLVDSRTQQLQDANEALETFAYSISHDFREPLRAMQGYAQILLEDHANQLDSTGMVYLNRLRMTADQMEGLLLGLLDYNRLSRTEISLQPINLTTLVQSVLMQFEEQIRLQQAQITVETPLLPVLGHYPTLNQSVSNLLTNALKFVAPGQIPQIRIYTELKRNSGMVRLWVEDNGIGIAPQYQERIFDAFERLHSNDTYPGTGIGLAIVRKGVERMGGQVGVESERDRGSRFWIDLPAEISDVT